MARGTEITSDFHCFLERSLNKGCLGPVGVIKSPPNHPIPPLHKTCSHRLADCYSPTRGDHILHHQTSNIWHLTVSCRSPPMPGRKTVELTAPPARQSASHDLFAYSLKFTLTSDHFRSASNLIPPFASSRHPARITWVELPRSAHARICTSI